MPVVKFLACLDFDNCNAIYNNNKLIFCIKSNKITNIE
jgi:hypothetical protein